MDVAAVGLRLSQRDQRIIWEMFQEYTRLKAGVRQQDEVDQAVEGMTSLLEPMIMAFLGVVIGGLVIAMYLPIFSMANQI